MRNRARWAVGGSLLLALAASAYLFFMPTYSAVSNTFTLDSLGGSAAAEYESRTLLQVNGPSALLPLFVPVLLSALPMLVWRMRLEASARVVAAVLLLGFVVITGPSVGMFYLPSAVAMGLGAAPVVGGWIEKRFLMDSS